MKKCVFAIFLCLFAAFALPQAARALDAASGLTVNGVTIVAGGVINSAASVPGAAFAYDAATGKSTLTLDGYGTSSAPLGAIIAENMGDFTLALNARNYINGDAAHAGAGVQVTGGDLAIVCGPMSTTQLFTSDIPVTAASARSLYVDGDLRVSGAGELHAYLNNSVRCENTIAICVTGSLSVSEGAFLYGRNDILRDSTGSEAFLRGVRAGSISVTDARLSGEIGFTQGGCGVESTGAAGITVSGSARLEGILSSGPGFGIKAAGAGAITLNGGTIRGEAHFTPAGAATNKRPVTPAAYYWRASGDDAHTPGGLGMDAHNGTYLEVSDTPNYALYPADDGHIYAPSFAARQTGTAALSTGTAA